MIRKEYEELCFTDDFMFCKVLSNNSELCQELLELVLGIKISRIELVEGQKSIEHTYDGRGIRLDVYVEDEENIVYDIEMQTVVRKNLPKRSRYYQGMIDLNLIKRGADFGELKMSYIIFICSNDPFGYGLPVYTFTNRCSQNPDIKLEDGSVKVIVNVAGSRDGISDEMASFLDYLQGKAVKSDFTRRLQDDVKHAIAHEEWRLEYMTLDMIRREEREEGREEGRMSMLYSLASDGIISISDAAKRAGMSEDDFVIAMNDGLSESR